MARTIRGCPTAWSQPDGAAELENSVSILQLEEQANEKEGEFVVDYEPDVDYEPEGPHDE